MVRTVLDKDVGNYLVIDLDKKEVIRRVQWANDETGMYSQLKVDKEGEFIREHCPITKEFETPREEKKGHIIFVKTNGITI